MCQPVVISLEIFVSSPSELSLSLRMKVIWYVVVVILVSFDQVSSIDCFLSVSSVNFLNSFQIPKSLSKNPKPVPNCLVKKCEFGYECQPACVYGCHRDCFSKGSESFVTCCRRCLCWELHDIDCYKICVGF